MMKHNELPNAVDCTLFTYLLMNRHSPKEEQIARTKLTLHLQQLIANGEHDQGRLVVEGLIHLREFQQHKAVRLRQPREIAAPV
jgi:hypothetical protein